MGGKGVISVEVYDDNQYVYIDIMDFGKGIFVNNYKCVFQFGFIIKKWGWGLGLSLIKCIVEEYYGGRIFVK